MVVFDNSMIPGYARFRIPGAVATARGTLLAYCEARRGDGDWSEIDILLRRSTDGGRTFSAPVVLVSGTKKKKTVNNPVMIAGRDGTVHFLCCVEYGVAERGGGVFYRRSEDDGATWSEPRDISAMTSPELRNVFAPGPGHGIELADGTLFVPCWTVLKKHGKKTDSHHPGTVCVLTSIDSGETWQISSFVPNGAVNDPNETAAAQLPDRRIILNIRDGDTHCRCCCVGDHGAALPRPDDPLSELRSPLSALNDVFALRTPFTFTPIAVLPEVPDPICCAGMVSKGDTLYLTHCRDTEKRRNLTLEQSADGVHWQTVQVLDPGDAGYSDLTTLNGDLLILYEKDRSVCITKTDLHEKK